MIYKGQGVLKGSKRFKKVPRQRLKGSSNVIMGFNSPDFRHFRDPEIRGLHCTYEIIYLNPPLTPIPGVAFR